MTLRVRIPRFPRASRRFLDWGAVVVGLMMVWMLAPLALRRLAFFRVRQVELVGIRYLDADVVLGAMHLKPRASVFDDIDVLGTRVRRLHGVADAAIVRRPPASLKVIVREVEPVALVMGGRGELTIVDGQGRPLPFDPASQGGIDLPVVQNADSAMCGVLARIQALDPALFQLIDAAYGTTEQGAQGGGSGGGGGGGAVILELGAHRVIVARDAGPEVIESVVLVAKDLAAKARSYVELDARYAGQVVVRRRGGRKA